jgi:hypothetical protein
MLLNQFSENIPYFCCIFTGSATILGFALIYFLVNNNEIDYTNPNGVELNIHKSLQELKINEITQYYREELIEERVFMSDIFEIINSLSLTDLMSSDINDIIISMLESLMYYNF